jgi:hypothetical protein
MFPDQAIQRRKMVVAGQGFNGTPTAPARRPVTHAVSGSDFQLGRRRERKEKGH